MKPRRLLTISLLACMALLTLGAKADETLPVEGTMPTLGGATTWLDSKALSTPELRGKVVLVDFWTYSCINSLRQIPYLREWAAKYGDHGLVVIGVHSPEFTFEKDLANVRQAVKDIAPGYPVAVDSDHAVWRAFNNEYWPALYFVDQQGRIRHHVFGEGEYERSEAIIRQLLTEAGQKDLPPATTSVKAVGAEAQADWSNLRTNETYVGSARAERFASTGGAGRGSQVYTVPARLEPGYWALGGTWTVKPEFAVSGVANARIAYRFHARDVHLVMGPSASGKPVRYKVLIDGKPPGGNHGVDVDDRGNGTVTTPRMYQLIRQQGPIADRLFEIEFTDPGIQVYAFTFG
jgi:thiol-disulfide isomerase/thioredoxin